MAYCRVITSTCQPILSPTTPRPRQVFRIACHLQGERFGLEMLARTVLFSLSDDREGADTSSLGLYYYHARFYSPLLGHFVSADPQLLGPSTEPTVN